MREHQQVEQSYRALTGRLHECRDEPTIHALAMALRDLAMLEHGDPARAKAKSIFALRDAFAAEVSALATAFEDQS